MLIVKVVHAFLASAQRQCALQTYVQVTAMTT